MVKTHRLNLWCRAVNSSGRLCLPRYKDKPWSRGSQTNLSV